MPQTLPEQNKIKTAPRQRLRIFLSESCHNLMIDEVLEIFATQVPGARAAEPESLVTSPGDGTLQEVQ
jgi:hypothetical protein